jgi:hypothetical protein
MQCTYVGVDEIVYAERRSFVVRPQFAVNWYEITSVPQAQHHLAAGYRWCD